MQQVLPKKGLFPYIRQCTMHGLRHKFRHKFIVHIKLGPSIYYTFYTLFIITALNYFIQINIYIFLLP